MIEVTTLTQVLLNGSILYVRKNSPFTLKQDTSNDNAHLYNNPNELSRRLSDHAGLMRQEVALVDASAHFAVHKRLSE